MTTVTTAVAAPFAWVPASHPARPLLDRLLADLPEHAAGLPGARVVAELRGTVQAGTAAPQRLYVSLQGADDDGRWTATTLHWSAGGPARWQRLPHDPKLPGLAAALAAAGPDAQVLRYVPLRRFTVRSGGRVVKVKRRSRLHDSWGRARSLEAAVRRGDGTVTVPRLLGVDDALSAYTQADVPGTALADLAHGPALLPLLAEAGAVHAALHRLEPARDAAALPATPAPADLLATAAADAAWAATVLPCLAEPLRRALALLAAHVPPPSPHPVTCHGDLVPSHLLGAPGRWTVIDHDLAQRGDAERDLALLVAGLAHDVPALADGAAADPTHAAAVAAYLDGYAAAGGRPADLPLAWHLLAAHVHHAALLVTKDRVRPQTVAGTLARLDAATERLAGTARR